TREGRAHAPHTATGHATTAGQPPPDGRGGSDRGAPRRAPPRPLGGRRSPGETGGTWKGEGGRGARRAPTGHRPDADHRPPTTAPPPEAARGPRRCRPVTHGGPPPRAGRPPPGGPRRAPDSQPHRPPPERGRALSPPQRPHTLPPPAPQPRGPEGAGRRPATAGQAQSGGTTDDDRPRRTGPGPAAREATGQGERPHDGESRRPSRRTARETRPEDPRRAGSTGRGGGEAVVAGATGDSQVRPSSQRSARAVGRPRRGRSEGLTKPSNRFSFATILPPEPKDFGFPEAARRVMGITPPHRQSASFMVGTTTGGAAEAGRRGRGDRPAGGQDRGPPSRAQASAPGRGAPPRPARDGGGGGDDDTGDGSGPRRAREARHTGARPRGAADGEGTEADGRTERGTDGMRPRGADTTRPAAEVGWPRATARGTAQSDPGEGTRVGRRGPPRDLTATGPPGTGAVPRHHPGTTAWRPHPRGAHAHRHPRSRSRPGENTLPPHTGAPSSPPTALTRAGPPAPPPSLRAPRALLRPGTPPARQRPGDDTHVRRGEAGSGPDRGLERGRSHARDEERRGRRRRRGGAGKHARRGPRDRDAGAVRGPEERDRARGRAPRNTSAGSHRHPHARAVPRRPGRRPAPAIPGAWPTTRPRRQGRRAVHPSSAIHPRQVRLPSESEPRGATPRAQRSRARRPGPAHTTGGPAARTRPPTCRTPGGAQRDPPPTRRGEARAARRRSHRGRAVPHPDRVAFGPTEALPPATSPQLGGRGLRYREADHRAGACARSGPEQSPRPAPCEASSAKEGLHDEGNRHASPYRLDPPSPEESHSTGHTTPPWRGPEGDTGLRETTPPLGLRHLRDDLERSRGTTEGHGYRSVRVSERGFGFDVPKENRRQNRQRGASHETSGPRPGTAPGAQTVPDGASRTARDFDREKARVPGDASGDRTPRGGPHTRLPRSTLGSPPPECDAENTPGRRDPRARTQARPPATSKPPSGPVPTSGAGPRAKHTLLRAAQEESGPPSPSPGAPGREDPLPAHRGGPAQAGSGRSVSAAAGARGHGEMLVDPVRPPRKPAPVRRDGHPPRKPREPISGDSGTVPRPRRHRDCRRQRRRCLRALPRAQRLSHNPPERPRRSSRGEGQYPSGRQVAPDKRLERPEDVSLSPAAGDATAPAAQTPELGPEPPPPSDATRRDPGRRGRERRWEGSPQEAATEETHSPTRFRGAGGDIPRRRRRAVGARRREGHQRHRRLPRKAVSRGHAMTPDVICRDAQW
ncbi:collagen alpha-1(I) chain-like, partial [Budorcas taxicolor]|uniref:collagen alpha-1(I) chain-like n=1 Tax=Budorcas taxicolor TaxID=37181 RepID=UPI00228370CD